MESELVAQRCMGARDAQNMGFTTDPTTGPTEDATGLPKNMLDPAGGEISRHRQQAVNLVSVAIREVKTSDPPCTPFIASKLREVPWGPRNPIRPRGAEAETGVFEDG